MRRRNTFFALFALIGILALGIGYAAVSKVTLQISGKATVGADSAYDVIFTDNITYEAHKIAGVDAPVAADYVSGSVDSSDSTGHTAKISVFDLSTAGDTVSVTYEFHNTSSDLSAELEEVSLTNSNTNYFNVTTTYDFDDGSSMSELRANAKGTVTITVEVIKTPITTEETADIFLEFTANPINPTAGN